MATSKKLYKVIFLNHGKIYEIFAKQVGPSDLYGFTYVGELSFPGSEGLLIDPAEERIKEEFAETLGVHLPMHSIVRIEEVKERGIARIRDAVTGEKVTPFPSPVHRRE